MYAMFAGTESYYASQATTAFAVDEPQSNSNPTTYTPTIAADLYFVPAIAAVVVLCIVIVLSLLMFMLVKKR